MNKKWLRLGALVGALALSLSACGGGDDEGAAEAAGNWDEVVAAAKAEGSVMLYSSHHPDNLAKLKEAFEKEYPEIKMEFVRGTDAELNPKIEVENQTGQGIADVHMVTDRVWITTAIESGKMSTDLVGPSFENEVFANEAYFQGGQFALTSIATFVMGWNTDLYPKGLTDIPDVLDPALKGKIGVLNPAGIAAFVDMNRYMTATYGADFLEKLAAQEPRIYASSLQIAQALASGEIAAAPMVSPLFAEKAAGAPVMDKVPPTGWGVPWFTQVLQAGKHPNAGQVLANYMASEAGQAVLSANYGSIYPDIEGTAAFIDDVVLADTTDLTPEDVAAATADWEKLFLKK